MTITFVTFIILIVYAAVMTLTVVKSTGELSRLRSDIDIVRNRLQSMSMDLLKTSEMYEARLSAKQEAIDALKELLLHDVPTGVNFSGGVHEGDTPPYGTTVIDPTK